MKEYCLISVGFENPGDLHLSYFVNEFPSEDEVFSYIKKNKWFDTDFFIFKKIESTKLELEKARIEGEIIGKKFLTDEFNYDEAQNYKANMKRTRYALYLSLKKEFENEK